MSRLATIIVEVLEVGGPRKHAILRALAEHHGAPPSRFRSTMATLVRSGKVARFRQHGGLHYRACST